MFFDFWFIIVNMQEFANHFLFSLKDHSLYVYIFIFLVSFFESFAFLGLVVPGAVFVISAGFLTYDGYFNFYFITTFAVLGAVLADIVSFYIGGLYSNSFSNTMIYEQYRGYFTAGESFFKKYGSISVFLGRFIGILRPVIPFVAGVLKMNKKTFYLWAVVSGILWGIGYIGMGYLLGKGFKLVKEYSKGVDYTAAAVLVLAALVYFLKKRGKWTI